MFNIQKAVSRLDYAPKLKEIKVTDIKQGLGVFTPLPDKSVSFAALKETLKKAGYTLSAADITLTGTFERDGQASFLVVNASGQRFVLEGGTSEKTLAGLDPGDTIEIVGEWKMPDAGKNSHEIINPNTVRKVSATTTVRYLGSSSGG